MSIVGIKDKKKAYLKADEQDDLEIDKYRLSDFKSFKGLLIYIIPYKNSFLFGLALMLGASLSSIATAWLTGALVDRGLIPRNTQETILYAASIITLELLALGFMWAGRWIIAKYSSLTIFNIRAALFEHLQNLPMQFFDQQPQGRVVTRITHDVEGIENFFTQSMGRLLNAIFMAIFAMTAMLITDWRLGGILVLSVIPAILFIILSKNLVKNVNRDMSRSNSTLNVKLSEFLNGLDVIRSYGLEKWSKREFQKTVDDYKNSHLKANTLFSWSRPLVSLLCSLPLIGLVWFGGSKVLAGTIGVGLFVTFIRYCERFFNPIMTLAREFHVIQQALTSSERVASFLEHRTEKTILGEDGKYIPKSNNMKGKIEFQNVFMNYDFSDEDILEADKKWVLKGLSFKINEGDVIGLVGTTGCGKTTTVSLLSRLYEFEKGEILLDGRSIRDYKRSFLRSQIGFVSQDAILFRGSLRDNLSTDENFDEQEILEAAKVTGLQRIMSTKGLSLGFEVLEGGINLSVGERQLVSLTRILLKNPSILILDEATANIDPLYEQIIHEAVNKVMEKRTCLMIAHRLATLEHCNRIFVFEKGELVESGNQEQLFEQKGVFFHLHQAQEAIPGHRDK